MLSSNAMAQTQIPELGPRRHNFHRLPSVPGRIGTEQMLRVPNAAGYFQPVELRGPKGSLVSMAAEGGFLPDRKERIKAGLLMGTVYRFRVGNVKLLEGHEVFPTVELINRLHPPPGMEAKFPVPVEITAEEVELAIRGHMVTRVIYLENPDAALGIAQNDEQRYFDVDRRLDPLEMADRMGRPIAILRMGSRVPLGMGDEEFELSNSPSMVYPEVSEVRQVPAAPGIAPVAPGATNMTIAPARIDPVAPASANLHERRAARATPLGGAQAVPGPYPRLPYRYEINGPSASPAAPVTR